MSKNQTHFFNLRSSLMASCLIAGFLISFCFAGIGLAQDEEPPKVGQPKINAVDPVEVKLDFLGDPLPQHAIARLGTNRFCPPKVVMLALSNDEKIVVTMGMEVIAWDAESGKQLWSKKSDAGWFGMNSGYGYQGICRMPVSGRLASNSNRRHCRFLGLRNRGKDKTESRLKISIQFHRRFAR